MSGDHDERAAVTGDGVAVPGHPAVGPWVVDLSGQETASLSVSLGGAGSAHWALPAGAS